MAYEFNPAEYDEPVGRVEIPDGVQEFIIDEANIKVWSYNDDGSDKEASVSFKMVWATPPAGSKDLWIFASFGIKGEDEKKMKRDRTNLAGLCRAAGHDAPLKDLSNPLEILKRSVLGEVQVFNGKKSIVPWSYKPVEKAEAGVRPHVDDPVF